MTDELALAPVQRRLLALSLAKSLVLADIYNYYLLAQECGFVVGICNPNFLYSWEPTVSVANFNQLNKNNCSSFY